MNRFSCYVSLAPHSLHHLVNVKQKEEFLKRIWFRFDTENCLIRYKSPKAGRGFDKTKEVPLRLLNGGGGFFLPQREVTQNKLHYPHIKTKKSSTGKPLVSNQQRGVRSQRGCFRSLQATLRSFYPLAAPGSSSRTGSPASRQPPAENPQAAALSSLVRRAAGGLRGSEGRSGGRGQRGPRATRRPEAPIDGKEAGPARDTRPHRVAVKGPTKRNGRGRQPAASPNAARPARYRHRRRLGRGCPAQPRAARPPPPSAATEPARPRPGRHRAVSGRAGRRSPRAAVHHTGRKPPCHAPG